MAVEPRMEGEPQTDIRLTPAFGNGSGAGFDAHRDVGREGGRHGGRNSSGPPPGGSLSGLMLSRVSAFYLVAGAVLLVIGVLVLSGMAGWYVSLLASAVLTARFIAALLVAQIMLLTGSGLAARLLWQRSRVVMALRKGDRMASRVMIVLLRSSGEVGALMLVFGALALGLAVIIAPDSLLQLLSGSPETTDWLAAYPLLLQWAGFALAGIAIIAAGASMAAIVLLMFGFFAEGLALMLQVADDIRRVRERLEACKGSDEVLRAFR